MIEVVADSAAVAKRIREAADITVQSLRDEAVTQEPHFTDRLLSRIEDAINRTENTQAKWTAATLRDRGRRAEETLFGADFLGVFECTTPELSTAKGFFAQAKLLESGSEMLSGEHSRLREQCRRMLGQSPDSFVFLYGLAGVRVVSANAVLDSSHRRLDDLGTKDLAEFFEDHFRCFIGDRRFEAPGVLRRWWPPRGPIYYSLGIPTALVISVVGR
jgi:hypothetical protein